MHVVEKCPYLPETDVQMSYRYLTESKKEQGADFYFAALKYGHYLWLNGHAGRGILAITRALYADIRETEPILNRWPLPYVALKWIVTNHFSDSFPGNPRVSFQHQATRLRGKRQTLRRIRAWAVWALVRKAKPGLCGDNSQMIEEPTIDWIATQLQKEGHTNEPTLWQTALDAV